MNKLYLKNIMGFLFIICTAIPLTACQPTPEKPIIINKTENIYEKIKIKETENTSQNLEEYWDFEKEYGEGKKLNVQAPICNNSMLNIPVVSIEEKPFDGNTNLIKKIITYFCDESYELLEGVNEQTKADIQENIIRFKQELQEMKQAGDPEYEISILENTIKYLERQLEEAPAVSNATATDYKLKQKDDGSYQLNIVAMKDGQSKIEINFVDWINTKGSLLLIQDKNSDNSEGEKISEYVLPDVLQDDAIFQSGKETADDFLVEIGMEYLRLNVASKYSDENTYEYYYTRVENGFQEGYIDSYFGSMQSDKDVAMDLWYAETMIVRVTDGKITYVKWDNPSMISGVDNDNVKIIPFKEAKEIFLKQIDYMLSPDIEDKAGKANYEFFTANTTINITKIELGLTKLLMKDSADSYKLIPTWNFYGYEAGSGHEFDKGRGAEICFVTINALDGSIVNHTAMN